jgi:hypothetical protein
LREIVTVEAGRANAGETPKREAGKVALEVEKPAKSSNGEDRLVTVDISTVTVPVAFRSTAAGPAGTPSYLPYLLGGIALAVVAAVALAVVVRRRNRPPATAASEPVGPR